MAWSKKQEYPRAQFLAPCFLISSLMTCFILLTNAHCTTTQTTTPHTDSPCDHDVVSNLETGCNNIMELFSVQANPSKFQFMLLSSNIDKCSISLCIGDIILKPEPHVKIRGVFLDDKLSFNQHISISCTKAARQLNALARESQGI